MYEVTIYLPGSADLSITRYVDTRTQALDAVDAAAHAHDATAVYGCPWRGFFKHDNGQKATASFRIRPVTYLLVAQDSGDTDITTDLEFYARTKGLHVDGPYLVDNQGDILYRTARI